MGVFYSRHPLKFYEFSCISAHSWGDVLAYIDTSGGRVVLKTYAIEDFDIAVDAELGAGSAKAIDNHGFKVCSPVWPLLDICIRYFSDNCCT